eukprot:g59345.t1
MDKTLANTKAAHAPISGSIPASKPQPVPCTKQTTLHYHSAVHHVYIIILKHIVITYLSSSSTTSTSSSRGSSPSSDRGSSSAIPSKSECSPSSTHQSGAAAERSDSFLCIPRKVQNSASLQGLKLTQNSFLVH